MNTALQICICLITVGPQKLAELLNTTMFVNEGLGGTSNTRIFRKAVTFIREYSKKADTKQLLVVVCWTTLDRDEIPTDLTTDKDWYIGPNCTVLINQ